MESYAICKKHESNLIEEKVKFLANKLKNNILI